MLVKIIPKWFMEFWNLNKRVKYLEEKLDQDARLNLNRTVREKAAISRLDKRFDPINVKFDVLMNRSGINRAHIDQKEQWALNQLKDLQENVFKYCDDNKELMIKYLDKEFTPLITSRLDDLEKFVDRIKKELKEKVDNPDNGGTLH